MGANLCVILHVKAVILLFCLGYGCTAATGATARAPTDKTDPFKWDRLPDLPVEGGIAGAFIGKGGPVLLLAGGYSFPGTDPLNSKRVYHDSVYALIDKTQGSQWRQVGTLPEQLADGASVAIEKGLLCIGGRSANGIHDAVYLLEWIAEEERLHIEKWPELPQPLFHLSAAATGNTVYIAGGHSGVSAVNDFLALPIDQGTDNGTSDGGWERLAPWSGTARFGAVLVAQNDGERDSLYLLGGADETKPLSDAFRYKLRDRIQKVPWTPTADPPQSLLLAPAASVGQSHIIVFGTNSQPSPDSSNVPKDILDYHTITDTWTKRGETPFRLSQTSAAPWGQSYIFAGGVTPGGNTTPTVWQATPQRTASSRFHPIDYGALFIYLGALVAMGYYFSRREQTTADFFLAGQRVPFWAAGLSMMATAVSSVGFMSVPAKSYATNLVYFAGVATWFVVVPLVTWAIIPFYRRLNVTTAFEYLEARFNLAARLVTALLFCIFQIFGRLGIVLYVPALALSVVTGLSPVTCILLMGVLATVYTVLGGMEAVIWTDVIQSVILLGGAIVCLVLCIVEVDGGISTFLSVGLDDGKFTIAILEWDPTVPVLWIILVGNVAGRFMGLTADQTIVQRYQSTGSTEQAKKALWVDVAVSIPWAFIVFGLGIALYVFYKIHPSELDPTLAIDGIVPLFIVQHVPIGLRGVIIAAIFAAAMSSVDSSMHSVATVLVNDFYKRFRSASSERFRLALARWLTGLLGVFGTGVALWMASLDLPSVWDWFLVIGGLFIGPQAGLFLLGIFTERANSAGALVGLCVGAAAVTFVRFYTDLNFFLYGTIGLAACVGAGYLASLLLPGKPHCTNLTIYSLGSPTPDSDQSIAS